MFEEDSKEFEKYLREFRPTTPSPLPLAGESRLTLRRLSLGLAAGFLITAALGLWISTGNRSKPAVVKLDRATENRNLWDMHEASLGRMNLLLRGDPLLLDQELINQSSRLLPNVEKPGSALGALAKE
jgi:hypothetical protein